MSRIICYVIVTRICASGRDELGDRGRAQVPCRHNETARGHIADGVFVAFGCRGGDGVLTDLVQRLPNIFENFVGVACGWTPHGARRDRRHHAQVAGHARAIDRQLQAGDVVGAKRIHDLDAKVNRATGVDAAGGDLVATHRERSVKETDLLHTRNHAVIFCDTIVIAVYAIHIDDLDDIGHRQIDPGRGLAAVVVDLEA